MPFELTGASVHLCVDMQRLFAPDGPWPTPWMERVLPRVARLAERFSERTVFTRFITPERPDAMPGAWRAYYARWRDMTRDHLDPHLLELVPPLPSFAPPAVVFDRPVYSAFGGARLHEHLVRRKADTLVVTGAETDVCVLATVLGAIDRGYAVVLVEDALCSSSDEGHDALLQLFDRRFSQQVAVATSEEVLDRWR
jgi:nicotinamidase-related amidase